LGGVDEADSLQQLSARYVYEVLPLLREYALEGELDEANLSALTGALGLEHASTQPAAVAALVGTLAGFAQPTTTAATPGPGTEPATTAEELVDDNSPADENPSP
jgi:5-methylcytosine-specific restriction protein B